MRIPLVPWLSFVFCYWYWTHLGVAISMVHGQCLEDQQSLLLQLKSSLQFNPNISRKLASWNESTDCCIWSCVTCDDEGHVSGLDLNFELIHGGLDDSSSLFSLQNLQVLNLAYNLFSSVIPSGFNKLKSLTYLNLSCAGFVGQVPVEISQLTRLVTLAISSPFSSGQQLELKNPSLQKLVQNLTGIKQLYLDSVTIASQGKEWCKALLQLPSLQEVSMSNCNLSGPLDSSLSTLTNLSIIRLDNNNLSSSVPDSFASFRNLTKLQLHMCGLGGTFPEKIFQAATLSVIDISYNMDLRGSLPEFQWNAPLKSLVVSDTNLSGALPGSTSKLRQLSILDLSHCQFNGTLTSSMSKLTELTYLDLSFNNFVGPIPSFNMSKNLTHLDMSVNYLTGSVTFAHFKGLTKLAHIALQDNFLNGSLPSSLFALPSVQTIQLSNNKFQGHLDGFLNISSTVLQTLDLSRNNLGGPIPASIFQLKSLRVLQLSLNNFSGTIRTDMFQGLENLFTLDLSYNQLSIDATVTDLSLSSFPQMSGVMLASCNLTEFPRFLRNQSRLTFLDLSSNHIQGSIPRWIWQLGSLTILNISHNFLIKLEGPIWNTSVTLSFIDLHSNFLQGRLPIFPVYAVYLDYSINNFSSTIPADIGTYLTSIFFLSLSRNNLSGRIPQSLCNSSNIVVHDFSHNHFQGTIPKCFTQSKTLAVLNLQHNRLDGKITDTFPRSCALRTLQLNGNQLVGPIPRTLQNCTKLEVLNLGNNQIFDVFPCFLRKLSTLRVMVLRENRLHGSIGCPMTTGTTWHMLQIVDLAFNNLSGTLTHIGFKTWEAMMLAEVHEALKFNETQSQVINLPDYYQDSVTLNIKGLQVEFVKILFAVTTIDFSFNDLHGPIPGDLMNLTGLRFLNLSHNVLTDEIPSAIGNLKQLESLDLSSNHFDGEVPAQLASLTFLSYLNLSFNKLVGRIPTGTQLQTFSEGSFQGNEGLCGPPLATNCSDSPLRAPPSEGNSDSGTFVEWNLLSAELGSVFGLGIIILPLIFWKRWRLWYWRHVDDLLFKVFPQLDFVYEHRGGQNYRTLRWRPY